MAITLRGTTTSTIHYMSPPIPDTDYIYEARDLGSTAYMYTWCVSAGSPFTKGTGYNFGSQAYIRNPIFYGDYVYIAEATGGTCDLFILNKSSDPTSPTLTKQLSLGDRPNFWSAVTDGDYWYLSNSDSYSSGKVFKVYNVTDKENPFLQGTSGANALYDGPTRVLFHPLDPNYILTCKNNTGIVTDVTTKATPTLTYTWNSTLFTKTTAYIWFETQQIGSTGYLFAAWQDYGGSTAGVEIWNITDPDPSTWSVVADFEDSTYGSGFYPINVVGNYIYGVGRIQSVYTITIIDISDIENPAIVDSTSYTYGGTGQKYTWFMTTQAGDPIIVIGDQSGRITAYDVPVSTYEFAGTLSHDASVKIINPSNFSVIREKSFSAGSYSFPSVTDETPYHVLAERDSDSAMLIYSDVVPELYTG